MAAKGYTTQTAVENYLLITIDPSFATQIDDWMASVESYIDNQTGRSFGVPAEATERLFAASGYSQSLPIDDCVSVEKAEIGDVLGTTFTETTDFFSLPFNTVPIGMLHLKQRPWPHGIHRVTAKWGFQAEIPADIKLAATVLLAGIINYAYDAEGEVQSMTIGRYNISYRTDQSWKDYERIPEILAAYRKFVL